MKHTNFNSCRAAKYERLSSWSFELSHLCCSSVVYFLGNKFPAQCIYRSQQNRLTTNALRSPGWRLWAVPPLYDWTQWDPSSAYARPGQAVGFRPAPRAPQRAPPLAVWPCVNLLDRIAGMLGSYYNGWLVLVRKSFFFWLGNLVQVSYWNGGQSASSLRHCVSRLFWNTLFWINNITSDVTLRSAQ